MHDGLHRDSSTERRRNGVRCGVICALVVTVALGTSSHANEPDFDAFIDEARATHWAFQPLSYETPPPASGIRDWERNLIDRFVGARLRSARLSPSPEGIPRVLLRRLSINLLGLPPKPDEIERFVTDTRPDSYERLVDRLLNSPRYGERWGRHWLDVARYADTKGYVFTQEPRFPYSFTYRDYVIASFNQDRPYDRFVREQIAADTFENAEPASLAALGFLTLGRRFSNNSHDILDDRIDVTTRGLLGLSVTCARCHDHKHDPISARDYYALYGIFASAEEPKDLPRLVTNESLQGDPVFKKFEQKLAALTAKVDSYVQDRSNEFTSKARENALEYIASTLFSEDAHARTAGLKRDRKELNGVILEAVQGRIDTERGDPKSGLRDWIDLSADALAMSNERDRELVASLIQREGTARSEESARETVLRELLYGESSPFRLSERQTRKSFNRKHRDELSKLTNAVTRLESTHEGAPPRAMALRNKAKPVEPRVFERGNAKRPGETVPRRFLTVLSRPDALPYDGAGRRDLARDITETSAALLARVFVNRLWAHHFGAGLVRTPSDFGRHGEPPTHPKLLDWLANEFIRSGWSVKHIQRLVVLSSAYRQRSELRTDADALDPQNVLLWRMPRRRLDFESTRDALLAVAGDLDLRMGGRSVDIMAAPFSGRRTLYGYVDRQNLPGLFRMFDFANPDASCSRRHETTVPQQALFLMNSELVDEKSRALSSRISGHSFEEKVSSLFVLTLGRPAETEEIKLARDFLADQASEETWARFAHVLLMSNEFAMID
jgi:hypothetical protein